MGVCMKRKDESTVSSENDKFEGIRLPLFEYSGREILPIKKWNQKVKEEIERVKSLSDGRTGGWVISTRPESAIFFEDDISKLKNVGKQTKDKLEKAGITKVKDLIFSDLSPVEKAAKHTSIYETSGVFIKQLQAFITKSSTALPGSPPQEFYTTHDAYKNTAFEDSYLFYHDALPLKILTFFTVTH